MPIVKSKSNKTAEQNQQDDGRASTTREGEGDSRRAGDPTKMWLLALLVLAQQLGAETSARTCGGAASSSLTEWQLAEGAPGLAVVIDALHCNFGSRPRYFATVVGAGPGWRVGSVVYDVSQYGFQVFVFSKDHKPAGLLAAARRWSIAWQGVVGRGSGSVAAGQRGWEHTGALPQQVSVDASSGDFGATPRYIVSLALADKPALVQGQHTVNVPSATGFRVYLGYLSGRPGSISMAGWAVDWVGTRSSWSGTATGPWTACGRAGAGLDVAIPAGKFVAPAFATSLESLGALSTGAVWTTGATALSEVSATGFKLCVEGLKLPQASSSWRVNYVGFDAPRDCRVSRWSECVCSATCGGGTCKQTRTVLQRSHHGKACPTLSRTRACNKQGCPHRCSVTPWGAWQMCTACRSNLATGEQLRYRRVQSGGPGGCPSLKMSRPCSAQQCPKQFAHPCGSRLSPSRGKPLSWELADEVGVESMHHTGGIFIDIDAGACGFPKTPAYVASISLPVGIPLTTGFHTISKMSVHGFRVHAWHPYLQGRDLLDEATSTHWNVNWIGDLSAQSGTTTVGATGWAQRGRATVRATVDVSAAEFQSKPNFVTSVASYGEPAFAMGAQTIYSATATGFRVYITHNPRNLRATFRAEEAEAHKLVVTWIGMPGGLQRGENGITHADFSGHAQAAWTQSDRLTDASFSTVDVSDYGFRTTPAFITTVDMGDESGRWHCDDNGMPSSTVCGLFGSGSLGMTSAASFRLYLGPPKAHSSGLVLAALSNMMHWRVNYVAFATLGCEVSAWGSWSVCSRSCGAGVLTRHRHVVSPRVVLNISARYAGGGCPRLEDIVPCNREACLDYCVFSPWLTWGDCLKPDGRTPATCGGGLQHSSRHKFSGGPRCITKGSRAVRKQRLCASRPCPVQGRSDACVRGKIQFANVAVKDILANPQQRLMFRQGLGDAVRVAPSDVKLTSTANTRSAMDSHMVQTTVAFKIVSHNSVTAKGTLGLLLADSFIDALNTALKGAGLLPPVFPAYRILRSVPVLVVTTRYPTPSPTQAPSPQPTPALPSTAHAAQKGPQRQRTAHALLQAPLHTPPSTGSRGPASVAVLAIAAVVAVLYFVASGAKQASARKVPESTGEEQIGFLNGSAELTPQSRQSYGADSDSDSDCDGFVPSV